ncbi:hypothetical protein B9Z55_021052 [Caenorhabditis nigoni]|uniref:Uncharacterized protein n=1 Tax=Caenorhabditis nigoni TaxID=1611254 RepID=A0A2G5TQE5_9PELO|nr:hypothetical protein B9Z55_021052 [Caenorhabditis nigoni]
MIKNAILKMSSYSRMKKFKPVAKIQYLVTDAISSKDSGQFSTISLALEISLKVFYQKGKLENTVNVVK